MNVPTWLPRWTFAVYALALFIATHWPALVIEGPVPRSDLYIHVFAFALWTTLLLACRFWGRFGSWANVARCVPLALAYAAVDEGLQAIPALHRTAAWDDFAANASGVLLAGAAAFMLGRMTNPRSDRSLNSQI